MPRPQIDVDERLARLRDAHPELRDSWPARADQQQRAKAAQLDGDKPKLRRKIDRPRRLSIAQTAQKQRAFLDQFETGLSVSGSARAIGLDRRLVYHWLEQDEQFSMAYHQAEVAALHVLEDEATRRAVKGSPYRRTSYWRGEPVGVDEKVEYSDALMQLLLRARAPDKYGQKLDVTTSQVIKTFAGFDPGEVLGRAPHST